MITIDDKLKLLKPIMGTRKVQGFRQMYYITKDFKRKKEIEARIDLLISMHVKTSIEDSIILPPPEAELCQGDIDIGEIEYLGKRIRPLSLTVKDLARHTGLFGATGSGKTTFALNLIRKLHKKCVPFMVFDWETSYRSLAKEFPDVEVLTVGSDINPLSVNILEIPPGVPRDEYIKGLINLFSEDYLSGAGSDTMFLNYLVMAFQEHEKPCFGHLKEIALREIQKDMKGKGRLSGRAGLWKETVQRIIQFLSYGASNSVIGKRGNIPLQDLFERNVVLEFGHIQSPRDRKFIIHIILNWLWQWTQYQGIESESLKQTLILEEFHNLTLKGNDDNLIDVLFRQGRKYGLGLVAMDQTPSEIPNSIFANLGCKVAFSLGTATDTSAMAKAMNMDRDNTKFLGMLRTGEAIINIKQRHHGCFLLKPPFVKEGERIEDSELTELMQGYSSQRTTKQAPKDDVGTMQGYKGPESLPPLGGEEKVVLSNIAERPLDGTADRAKRLGLHPSEMVKVHDELSKKGMIKAATIDGKKLMEITEHGKVIATREDIKIPRKEGRGGLEHSYWIARQSRN